MSAADQSNKNRLFLTNNYSILSKYSASKSCYFQDELLEDFIEWAVGRDVLDFSRRTVLVNQGYAARQMAMEWAVERTLTYEAIDCVVILGAGFDTLSLRYHTKFKCHWVEIDLPYVIEYKRQYIETKFCSGDNNVIVSSDGNVASYKTLNLHLVSCDLRNQADLNQRLSLVLDRIHCSERRRVAVVNEVCLCYLEPFEAKQIFLLLKELLRVAGTICMNYIGFEQVKASDSSTFARIMMNHFNYMGFPLKNFPTQQELLDLLVGQLNFINVTIINMFQVHHNILLATRLSRLRPWSAAREPFDEFEELDLYLSHYALVTGKLSFNCDISASCDATRESCDDLTSRLETMQLERDGDRRTAIRSNRAIQRYGHSSCVLFEASEGKMVLVSGGFGRHIDSANFDHFYHQRLDDCIIIACKADQMETVKVNVQLGLKDRQVSLSRMHGQVCLVEDGLIFFNGGRQSPQIGPRVPDNSFVARMDQSRNLTLVAKMAAGNSLRWRHKTHRLSREKFVQIGGIRGSLEAREESAVNTWDLSSDRRGFYGVAIRDDSATLDRHSFGADLMDANTVVMFGGLKASDPFDHPVDADSGLVCVDLRSAQLNTFKIDNTKQSYDSQLSSVSGFQFVKLGGVSTLNGLPVDTVEVYDLRNIGHGLPVSSEPLAYVHSADAGLTFIPTKMTSAHFRESKTIMSIGGGGNLFTFGTHFNECHLELNYES